MCRKTWWPLSSMKSVPCSQRKPTKRLLISPIALLSALISLLLMYKNSSVQSVLQYHASGHGPQRSGVSYANRWKRNESWFTAAAPNLLCEGHGGLSRPCPFPLGLGNNGGQRGSETITTCTTKNLEPCVQSAVKALHTMTLVVESRCTFHYPTPTTESPKN